MQSSRGRHGSLVIARDLHPKLLRTPVARAELPLPYSRQTKKRMCDETSCLASVGNGSWHGTTWTWQKQCCDFGLVGAPRARELLRGRQLVFLGDSTARRHMWAVVDAVGGEHAVRRREGAVVPDSGAAFDRAAVARNDTLYDSQRAYHAGQVVLLNVDSGSWRLVDPLQLCGVPKEEWTVDGRLVHAMQQGRPPPWHSMRGRLG